MMNPRVSLIQGFLISGCHAENRKRISYKWEVSYREGFLINGGFTLFLSISNPLLFLQFEHIFSLVERQFDQDK